MKISSEQQDISSTTKKSKKKKKSHKKKLKKHLKSTSFNKVSTNIISETAAASTSSFCSFDNVSTINESNSKIILTPSKSEHESRHQVFPEFEASDLSCSFIDENSETEENGLYAYNSIVDEFIGDDVVQESEAKIVSPSDTVYEKITRHKDVSLTDESFESTEPPLKKSKKTKKKAEPLIADIVYTANEEDKNISETTAQYYYTNDGVIVVLNQNDSLYFHGLMSISVLHGEIEILGYKVTKNCQDLKLYSLRSASLLCFKNITSSNVPVTDYLLNLNILKRIELRENCCIILCKKLDDPSIAFIAKHVSQQILPRNDGTSLPRAVFQPKGNWNLYKSSEEWDRLIEGVNQSTKMMFCGGKGVGKSTLLRYLINRLLMKFSEIRVIDLDPGQPEFTIPGCISVVKINEPIFGANYTHLKRPERSILSNINIGFEPEKYIEGVKFLMETLEDEIPTLINYMGFTHGIGINILSAAIIHVQPTDIIQINSQNNKKNYKHILTKNVILSNAGLFANPGSVNLDYKLHVIPSMCDENDGWTAEPRQLREMNILAYLSQMTESNSLFRTKAPMYSVGLEHVIISDLNGNVIHPAAVNASLVALCSLVNKSSKIFECHGWGIVRGIDMDANTLVLLTLEEASVLDKVSHIVLNSAPLPPSVFMTPDEVVGNMPYVMEGILMSFGQIPKRSRMPAKSKEL